MDRSDPEVQKHVKQAHHNFRFFCEVHSKLPDLFYDWKITVLFYTAVHSLRAIMAQRDVIVDNSHYDLRKNIDPKNNIATKPVKKFCFNAYVVLYNASLESRYAGFISPAKRLDYLRKRLSRCEEAIQSINSYFEAEQFPGFTAIQEEFDFDAK